MENRAISSTPEQVIVSYPREILFQLLWKSYSYVREFLSFPTMWQRNVSFRNVLCLFPYFWNWIKTSQVHWLFCQLENFPLLGNLRCWACLHLQYLIFLMTISLEVLFFEENLVGFQKWSRLRMVPYPSAREAWHEKWSRNLALNFWPRLFKGWIALSTG